MLNVLKSNYILKKVLYNIDKNILYIYVFK